MIPAAHLYFLQFLLEEVHHISDVLSLPRFAHLDKEQARELLASARQLANQEMAPYFKAMDDTPVAYDGKGNVLTHSCLKTIIPLSAEQGWIGGNAAFEHGGMQIPEMIFGTAHHLFQMANNGVEGYLGLSSGAAGLITSFGSPEQIQTFVPKIFAGEWQGTMALTEPQAGSSLTDITTQAIPMANGEYQIKGHKIFISGGQHEACSNFIHLTLARIPGAPAGVKGISLFIVPKFRSDGNGGWEDNDVYCAGDFQKMGQRGYATTHLVFGDKDNCHGYLVGEANKGLGYMFQMMNGARISVGLCAASVAMAAYQASLQYAKERPQGRLPGEKDPARPPVLIIEHADVQRMLWTQKVIAEGSLSLGLACNKLYDQVHGSTGAEKEKYHLLLEILTPIIKTYAAEQGSRSAALAIQTLGGYGYTTDFPVQQHYRDLKIMSLYEGTTGIQSLDLLGRKMIQDKGKAFAALMEQVQADLNRASLDPRLGGAAQKMGELGLVIQDTLHQLQPYLEKGQTERFLADATVFMEMMSTWVIGWQWVCMGLAATKALDAGVPGKEAFYQGKIQALGFFVKYEIPHAFAAGQTLVHPEHFTAETNWERFD